ncbi:MAG: TolC family protein, partial [Phaeodactylibacter sp.]|nr:TolC family protein [Phaeodactylibacter sp.]
MNSRIKQLYLVPALVVGVMSWTAGQGAQSYLRAAVDIAAANFAGLERDRLAVAQQRQLATSGLPMQATQLFFSGEEFNFEGQSGVQSFNIQQNFYLPKAAKAQRSYYEQGAALAEGHLVLTGQELKRQVAQAFYRLQYARQAQALAAESVLLHQDFLQLTTAQLERGESGKIPQLAARSRLAMAQLEQEKVDLQHQTAFALFNEWLQTDTLYDAKGELPFEPQSTATTGLAGNPHLQLLQAQQALAEAGVETQKAQLLPQINSGLRLQNAFGDFPLFGYQLGINVPI